MAGDKNEFAGVLEAIEGADRALVAALDQRARAVERYLELRVRSPQSYHALPSRAEVVRGALQEAQSFPRPALEQVMREVLGACDAMIAPLRVAVLGSTGGFASVAARRHFGTSAELTEADTISAVMDEVERKRSSYGIVPFESSTDGSVGETIEALISAEAKVCGEIVLPNSYHLVNRSGTAEEVEKVYAPSAAIVACERTVRRELPRATLLDVQSVSVATRLAAEDGTAAALIAVELDPELPLRMVRERIEDRVGVSTRYFVVGHERPPRTGEDRTLLAVAVRDQPGSLYRALHPFADRGVNLTRIESRVTKVAGWRWIFLLELEGHVTDRPVLTTVEEVRAEARHLKVLGSYPRPA
ncbi:MAG: bifunctional chorismate mutase/prephenate dehydratase [Sandaracinaceae bacterium]